MEPTTYDPYPHPHPRPRASYEVTMYEGWMRRRRRIFWRRMLLGLAAVAALLVLIGTATVIADNPGVTPPVTVGVGG